MECSKYFLTQEVLDRHKLSKAHKQRAKRVAKDQPWTTEDARVIGVDNGKPLGRAPHPVQFKDSPALAYRNGAVPPAPSEAAAAEAAMADDGSTTSNTAASGEDLVF